MSDEVLDAAEAMQKEGVSEAEARAGVLRDQITSVKNALREGVAELFCIHPDDLT